jgi:hypothetical protein
MAKLFQIYHWSFDINHFSYAFAPVILFVLFRVFLSCCFVDPVLVAVMRRIIDDPLNHTNEKKGKTRTR